MALTTRSIPDLRDKESLVKHVKAVYNEVLESSGSQVMAAQSIANSISHYAHANQLDLKVPVRSFA